MSDDKEYQIQKLSKALELQGQTIMRLEQKVETAKAYVSVMEREKKQWMEQKALQEKIIQQQLALADQEKRKLQDEILELRAKLKAA